MADNTGLQGLLPWLPAILEQSVRLEEDENSPAVGHSAKVFRIRMSGRVCAHKRFKASVSGTPTSLAARDAQVLFIRESRNNKIISDHRHDHLVCPLYSYRNGFIIYPWAKYSLRSFLDSIDPSQPESLTLLRRWAGCIAGGLYHMHNRPQMAHGDITPSNLLANRDNTILIADFGNSRVLTDNSDTSGSAPWCGFYVSPEAINCGPSSLEGDIWSFGMVVLEMLTNLLGFTRQDMKQTVGESPKEAPECLQDWIAKLKHDVEEDISTLEMLSIVESCLKEAPNERPTTRQVLDRIKRLGTRFTGVCCL